MLIIPAVDLRGGRVVRLRQGEFDQERFIRQRPNRSSKNGNWRAPS